MIKEHATMVCEGLLFCVVLSEVTGGGSGECKETMKTIQKSTLHNNRMTDISNKLSIKTARNSKCYSLTTFTPKNYTPQGDTIDYNKGFCHFSCF